MDLFLSPSVTLSSAQGDNLLNGINNLPFPAVFLGYDSAEGLHTPGGGDRFVCLIHSPPGEDHFVLDWEGSNESHSFLLLDRWDGGFC
mmetsp:Transcript_12854/g.29924  ORF Transcript_12854/g.29924 Transcript_12854/m.29924 type:complete len:88 (-) Transcript_12854:179-442(-)